MSEISSTNYAEYIFNDIIGLRSVNLDGIQDKRVLHELVTAFAECLELYPAIIKSICHIGNPDDINYQLNLICNSYNQNYLRWTTYDDTEGAFAVFSTSFDESSKPVDYIALSIRPYIMESSLEQINYEHSLAASHGLYAKNCYTIKSIIWHEIGHVLDKILRVSKDARFLALIKDVDITKEISDYAAINHSETFAEAFAEYHSARESTILIAEIAELANQKYEEEINQRKSNFDLAKRYGR